VPEYKTLLVRREGPVDWVTLNRPERLNSVTGTMVRELWSYFSEIEHDYSRRVVVLRGAGKHFCAGLDLKVFGNPEEEIPMGRGQLRPEASLPGVIRLMRRCPQPVIGLIHGAACGGGLAFALACDIRVAGESARMNDAFIKLGISGCELGLSYFLPRMVGLSVASELMLTGRFVDAARALSIGLVSRVVPDDEIESAARDYLVDLLRATPLGLRQTKATLNLANRLNELDAVLDLEQHVQMECMRSGDFDEALAAFTEKREPRFST
jgi:enoyl-CoA hydratase/carnithine racemase